MSRSPAIDVARIAGLARIEITPDEAVRLQADMDAILAYVGQLEALDLEGVEPTDRAASAGNAWRGDTPAEPFPREAMLANAPARAGADSELIKVPCVLPGEEGA